MSIEPDLTRRCPAVDPDDHHLFVAPGCAAENLAQAALANGLQATIRFDPEGAGSMRVSLADSRDALRVVPGDRTGPMHAGRL